MKRTKNARQVIKMFDSSENFGILRSTYEIRKLLTEGEEEPVEEEQPQIKTLKSVFEQFSIDQAGLDNKTFLKLVTDSGLLDKKL